MGIASIRDAFNTIAADRGIRCTGALLNYCDKDGKPDGLRTHQRLVFNCVKDGAAVQYETGLLPPGTDVVAAAQDVARKVIEAT